MACDNGRHVIRSDMDMLSVVVPVYECEGCLGELHHRLTASLGALDLDYEIVLVDDRSRDRGWDVVQELAARDARVRGIRLSRNFGQSAAITAGIAQARGDWILLMDCDLQDRPEDIHLLLEAADGKDIVFTRRPSRDQTLFRRAAARAYFRFRNALLGIDSERDLGSLILLSRKVADAYVGLTEPDRQHALLLWWLGFERGVVEVAHGRRFAGKSSYTFGKLVRVAVEGIFFQSSRALQWIVYAGLAVALGGFAFAIVAVVEYFTQNHPIVGWTSLVFVELVLGGAILVALGVAALYVGRVFEQTKERPLFIVDERVAGETESSREHRATTAS